MNSSKALVIIGTRHKYTNSQSVASHEFRRFIRPASTHGVDTSHWRDKSDGCILIVICYSVAYVNVIITLFGNIVLLFASVAVHAVSFCFEQLRMTCTSPRTQKRICRCECTR
jgi:hypothetical protein